MKQNHSRLDLTIISMSKLNSFLKKTKTTPSTGHDGISNIMLKNVSTKFKEVLIHLYKTSFLTNTTPMDWKKASVKMISKKDNNKKDAKNTFCRLLFYVIKLQRNVFIYQNISRKIIKRRYNKLFHKYTL